MMDENMNVLTIESDARLTEAQAKELTLIMHNSNKLMAFPDKKISDFKVFITVSTLTWIALIVYSSISLSKKVEFLPLALLIIPAISLLFNIFFIIVLRRTYKKLLAVDYKGKVVFSKNGIDYENSDGLKFFKTWDQYSFARGFDEVFCIFPNKKKEMMLVFSVDEEQKIIQFISQNYIGLRVVRLR